MILSDGGEEVLGRGERGVHCVVGVEPREVPDHGRSCVCVCVCVVEEGRGGGERGGGGRDREERRGGVLGGAGCVLHRGPTGHTHARKRTHARAHTQAVSHKPAHGAGVGGAGRGGAARRRTQGAVPSRGEPWAPSVRRRRGPRRDMRAPSRGGTSMRLLLRVPSRGETSMRLLLRGLLEERPA